MQSFLAMTVLSVSLLVITSSKINKPISLTPQKEKGWVSLFDGKTTKGWHTYGKNVVTAAWKVADGNIYLDASHRADWISEGGGDIVTDQEFENFHLKLDWKISTKGNSGVIFWIQDEPTKYKNDWFTGPEMQVLDNDGHPDGKIIKHRAGNLYDLVEGKEGAVKPVGEWNTAEIVCNKGKLDLFLNGVNTVSTMYGDDNWRTMIAGSKFKIQSDFGKTFKGHIALQDHGNDVWYRNIMIKKL